MAGKQSASVTLELVAIEGRLAHIAVACKVPAADVFVDGARVGTTPLLATITVAPGAHDVEIRRAGYTSAHQRLTLQDGLNADLALTPTVDREALRHEGGYLEIRSSETQSVLSVDGEEVGVLGGGVSLPVGPHRIQLERGGFLTAQRDVDVPLGKTQTVQMVFEPTPETRVHYVAGAQRWRRISWVTLSIGVALAAGGTTLALIEQRQLPAAQSTYNAYLADQAPMSQGPCDTSSVPVTDAMKVICTARLQSAADRVNSLDTWRTVGWIGRASAPPPR